MLPRLCLRFGPFTVARHPRTDTGKGVGTSRLVSAGWSPCSLVYPPRPDNTWPAADCTMCLELSLTNACTAACLRLQQRFMRRFVLTGTTSPSPQSRAWRTARSLSMGSPKCVNARIFPTNTSVLSLHKILNSTLFCSCDRARPYSSSSCDRFETFAGLRNDRFSHWLLGWRQAYHPSLH